MRKNHWRPILFVCIMFVGGCGATDDMRLAEAGVTQVHAQMDAEQFADIYSHADEAFRGVSKQQDFLEFMAAVHRKL